MKGALAIAAVTLLPSCEAVPTLTFDAAGGEAADATIDGAEAGCPTVAPLGATCCGSVPCYGMYCATGTNCSMCAARCEGGDICCAKYNNAVCLAHCN